MADQHISTLTETELKALVYDELAKMETAQANIRILNQEIQKRSQLKESMDVNLMKNGNKS